ncbi:MAG: SurA N-terminal domain-containing protein [Candidatus Omnitrophota bacterium]
MTNHFLKSKFPNPKSQTNANSNGSTSFTIGIERSRGTQIPIFHYFKFRFLVIWVLVLIWNFVFGISTVYAQDKIVAVVNNEAITQRDLNDFFNFTQLQLSREYNEAEAEKRIEATRKDLLEKLIEDRLILQEAKAINVKVDDNRIKAKINEIRRHYSSEADFQNDLAKQGLVQADLERKIREQMLMYMIVEQSVQDKIMIRPDEVTTFYNKNMKEFVTGEERECDIVILDTDREDSAREFENLFRSGQKLEDLQKRFPLTVDKIVAKRDGGLRQDIEEKVCSLNPGEYSQPLKVNNKFYIFKLLKITPPRQLTLSEAQVRIQAYLFDLKMQEQFSNWLDGLKKKAYIKILQDNS